MKKRWIILISNILSVTLILICLSGCKWLQNIKFSTPDPWEEKQSEGSFYYSVEYIDGEESAVILGLTDGFKTRGELVIPETLGGYPVKRIGYSWLAVFGGETKFYGIKANNIEKIVLNHSMHLRQYSFIDFNGTLVVNSEQEYGYAANYDGEHMIKNMKAVYLNVPRDIDEIKIYRLFNDLDNNHYGIIFHANGDGVATSGIIKHTETDLEIPEEPTKQGYKFLGWYTDTEGTEIWNPDESISGKKVTDVYAKWIEE